MMKNLIVTSAFLIGTCIVIPSAYGNDDLNITLEGRLISAAATIPSGFSSAELFDVRGKKILIVTQFCSSSFMGPELFGSKLGRVPADNTTSCTNYVPGVVFKGGQTVSCNSVFGPVFEDVACLINGVIQ